MVLTNEKGALLFVEDNHFAQGGEGSIHTVLGYNLVAKIYNDKERTPWREKKLLGMTAISTTDFPGIAWPKAVLYERGNFVGFVMENIANTEKLSTIFINNPGKYNFKDKLDIAISLCERVSFIHSKNQCIGDFSDQNIGVRGNTAFLYDADSFQFNDYLLSKQKYRCVVYTDDYVAPEVLKALDKYKSLRKMPTTAYSIQSDLFVLAIHIFKLLYGCHPFACRVTGNAQQPCINDSIKNGFSPFFIKRTGFDIPISAPPLTQLPVNLQTMFETAFITGNQNPHVRPTADRWLTALKLLRQMPMKTCSKKHAYLEQTNTDCPWCKAIKKMHANGVVPSHPPVMAKPQPTPGNTPTYVAPSPPPGRYITPPPPKVKHSAKFWTVAIVSALIVQFAFWIMLLNFTSISSSGDLVLYGIMSAAGIIGPILFCRKIIKKERWWSYLAAVAASPLFMAASVAALLAISVGASFLLVIGILAFIISLLNG